MGLETSELGCNGAHEGVSAPKIEPLREELDHTAQSSINGEETFKENIAQSEGSKVNEGNGDLLSARDSSESTLEHDNSSLCNSNGDLGVAGETSDTKSPPNQNNKIINGSEKRRRRELEYLGKVSFGKKTTGSRKTLSSIVAGYTPKTQKEKRLAEEELEDQHWEKLVSYKRKRKQDIERKLYEKYNGLRYHEDPDLDDEGIVIFDRASFDQQLNELCKKLTAKEQKKKEKREKAKQEANQADAEKKKKETVDSTGKDGENEGETPQSQMPKRRGRKRKIPLENDEDNDSEEMEDHNDDDLDQLHHANSKSRGKPKTRSEKTRQSTNGIQEHEENYVNRSNDAISTDENRKTRAKRNKTSSYERADKPKSSGKAQQTKKRLTKSKLRSKSKDNIENNPKLLEKRRLNKIEREKKIREAMDRYMANAAILSRKEIEDRNADAIERESRLKDREKSDGPNGTTKTCSTPDATTNGEDQSHIDV